jgi:adenylate cyclase
MEERYARREANAAYLAMVHAALGDMDKAFEWLEKDFQSRAGTMGDLAWDPYFDLFRSDPRYADLLKRMGLKQ